MSLRSKACIVAAALEIFDSKKNNLSKCDSTILQSTINNAGSSVSGGSSKPIAKRDKTTSVDRSSKDSMRTIMFLSCWGANYLKQSQKQCAQAWLVDQNEAKKREEASMGFQECAKRGSSSLPEKPDPGSGL
ncbi:hypothetical protein ACFE04_017969 [Oxalis oulophora]